MISFYWLVGLSGADMKESEVAASSSFSMPLLSSRSMTIELLTADFLLDLPNAALSFSNSSSS